MVKINASLTKDSHYIRTLLTRPHILSPKSCEKVKSCVIFSIIVLTESNPSVESATAFSSST